VAIEWLMVAWLLSGYWLLRGYAFVAISVY